ncbi:unnamed protein product [Polarella glacialis]|uniref:Uncharacterized protein n=1 Tax=Polarella glacialis TaxID=89957 RepID=A0A813EY16_POLGL|nr:unnamed protein product [Polarella glacialis]
MNVMGRSANGIDLQAGETLRTRMANPTYCKYQATLLSMKAVREICSDKVQMVGDAKIRVHIGSNRKQHNSGHTHHHILVANTANKATLPAAGGLVAVFASAAVVAVCVCEL